MHKVRGVLVGNSKGLSVHTGLLIHVDCLFWLLGIDIGLLCLWEVPPLEVELSLVEEDLVHALGVVLPGNRECRVPVLLVLVHVDGLLRLVGLDEFLLSLFEPILVLKVQGVLEMDLWELVFGVVRGEPEGVLESLLVSLEIDGSLDEAILNEELGAFLSFHILRDLDRDLSKLLGVAISLRDSQGVLPHLMGAIHVDCNLPGATFNIVVLCLL